MLRRGSISPGDRHNMLPWNPLKTFPFSWNPLKHFLFPRNPLKHFIFLKSTPNISFLLKSTLNISFCPEINFKHFLFCQKKLNSYPKGKFNKIWAEKSFPHLIGGQILETQAALVGIRGTSSDQHCSVRRELVFLLSLTARYLQFHFSRFWKRVLPPR